MGTVLRCVRADYLKAKRSMLNVIYIIVPPILALVFAGYFHISSWNRTLKISAFLEMLGIIYRLSPWKAILDKDQVEK